MANQKVIDLLKNNQAMAIDEKISKSIELLRKGEKLALKMQPDAGYYVGFSGGKDSQVLLELCRMAGVRHKAYYNVTTNDPPDNVRFIRQYYPEITFTIPPKSYYRLIETKGLPTSKHRWCCYIFKERMGAGYCVLTGIRHEESRKRAQYAPVMRRSRTSGQHEQLSLAKMETNHFDCIDGKDKIMIYPILDWTYDDVWQFIKLHHLPINPCYQHKGRVGCVYCPFAPSRSILTYIQTHPKQHSALLHALELYLSKSSLGNRFDSAEDCFDWWLSKVSINEYRAKKRQLTLTFNEELGHDTLETVLDDTTLSLRTYLRYGNH